MTQAEAASRVGVSQGHISAIETGRSTDWATIQKLTELLEIDFGQLGLQQLGITTESETQIAQDPGLRPDDRELLLEIYRSMRRRGPLGVPEAVDSS